ncbi:MAG: hypothetical protein IH936_14655 [Acidobacteria bacterium]|nr:hypothetical protein [Acidobacteriota bacterium]
MAGASQSVEDEVTEVFDYLEDFRDGLGDRFLADLEKLYGRLTALPESRRSGNFLFSGAGSWAVAWPRNGTGRILLLFQDPGPPPELV